MFMQPSTQIAPEKMYSGEDSGSCSGICIYCSGWYCELWVATGEVCDTVMAGVVVPTCPLFTMWDIV